MTPRPVPAPVSNTSAAAGYAAFAVTRMAAIAREHGLAHYTLPRWAVCSCTDGTHPWDGRQGTADPARAWDVADAANRSLDGPPTHVIAWEWWHGSSPARIADRAESETRA